MAIEEANDDPQSRNPTLFRERIRHRIRRGRDFVLFDDDTLIFKTNVSAMSPLGGQIEGIYTVPSARGNGFGRKGTSAVTGWVLERGSRAVLLVNEDNAVAKQLYQSLGYARIGLSQTVLFDILKSEITRADRRSRRARAEANRPA